MKMKGGRVATGGALQGVVQSSAGPTIHRAGLAVQAGIQGVTPVKQGTLRRGWTTAQPAWRGTRLSARVSNAVVYARYQNERTVNRGFVRRGYEGAKEQAKAIVKAGLEAIGERFWKG